jgi:hypothetical protein
MIKKIIFTGFMGLYLCVPHINAQDIHSVPEHAQITQKSTDIQTNEPTPDLKSEPAYVRYTPARSFDQRCINFLIAFCVNLAFMLYQRSANQDIH